MAKPTHLDWDGTNGVIEPSAGKKGTGWASAEKPAFQYMNWVHNISDQWHKYLDGLSIDEGAYNVGMVLSAGSFKLVQADGSDFANTDGERGYIVMQSQTNPGRKVVLEITAATHLFIDDNGASDILGEEFGTTAGVAWANARPFYLYAVNADDTSSNLRFAISPRPNMRVSPATANIGWQDNPMGTPSDLGMFFLTATNPSTTHDAVPALRIGGIRMTKSAADDWTVQTITESSGDGIRRDPHVGSLFTMPLAQNGAATGTFFFANGGTAPVFTNNGYVFTMELDGTCWVEIFLTADGGTDGAGAVTSLIATPYSHAVDNDMPVAPVLITLPGGSTIEFIRINNVSNPKAFSMADAANGSVLNSDFSNGNRAIATSLTYKAF